MSKTIRKAISTLLAAALMMSLLCAMPVTAGAAETHTVTDAAGLEAALDAAASGDTIRLGASISYGKTIYIDGKTITFALDGHVLDVSVAEGNALAVRNGGMLLLSDPLSGEFNLSSTAAGNATVSTSGAGSKAEATSAAYAGPNDSGAVFAHVGSEVTIYGDATNSGEHESSYGVFARGGSIAVMGSIMATGAGCGAIAREGGDVTVEGAITTLDAYGYVRFQGGNARAQAWYTPPTTKPGYLTYTDGISTIW